MAGGAADQAAQHVAAALVGGHDAVGNHKGSRTDMVGNQTDGNVLRLVLLIFRMGELADLVPEGAHSIHVKDGIHILHHAGQTLQAHAGVDVLLLQLGIMVMAVVVKLGKYVVPDLHVAVAVAAYGTAGLAAAVLLASVVVHLRAGAAGSRAVLPEIILLAEAENPLRRDADLLIPDIEGLVVVQVDGRIQAFLIEAHHLGQEFPGPVDRLSLKIIAEGEIAQHLEEGTVAGCLSHIFNIAGTDTFLAGGHPSSGRNLRACEIRLQRSHTGIDQQKALVIVRHERKALHHQMSLALKKFQKHSAKFIYAILFHLFPPGPLILLRALCISRRPQAEKPALPEAFCPEMPHTILYIIGCIPVFVNASYCRHSG